MKDLWYKKAYDLIDKLASLYNFTLIIDEQISDKTYRINNFKKYYFYSKVAEYRRLEFDSFVSALLKTFNIKDYKVVENKYIYDDIEVGSILKEDNHYNLEIDISNIFKILVKNNKNLDRPKRLHLVILAQGDDLSRAVKVSNICRLGGLSCEIDDGTYYYDVPMFELAIEGEITLIRNNETSNEENINENDVYPYIISYMNSKSKCKSCKEKEE